MKFANFTKKYGIHITIFLMWVGLHFTSNNISWRNVLGIGIILLALAIIREI